MSKFSITAELGLQLNTSDIQNQLKKIESIGNEKSNRVRLKVRLQPENFRTIFSRFDRRRKNLENAFKRKPLVLGIKPGERDIRLFFAELTQLQKSFSNNPLRLSIKPTTESIAAFFKERRALSQSFEGAPLGLDIKVDTKSAKLKIASLRNTIISLREFAQEPIFFNINTTNVGKLNSLVTLLQSAKSRNVSLGVNIKKNTVENVRTLSLNLRFLSRTIEAIQTEKLGVLTQSLGSLATSLKAIKQISASKITLDISAKNVKNIDKLSSIIGNIGKKFERASLGAAKFNDKILQSSFAVKSLRDSLNGINFSAIDKTANSVRKISSNNVVNNQKKFTKSVEESKDSLFDLGAQSADTLRRFGAYTLVTAIFFRLSFAIRGALQDFVEFDEQLTKIRQVTKQSARTTQLLGDEVGRLATTYGVSSQEILETSQVLAQAGFSANDTREALEALAKTELAPTFESLENTTEASIALMAQFNREVGDLEESLSAINSVAAAFAVESEDISTAIQKAGGAFQAAGGSLEELVAQFSAVRSTTRESADTIAVGIRTIVTRLQRVRTAKFLEDLGINIRQTAQDVERFGGNVGDFIGPFRALQRISQATADIRPEDPRFAQIAEELGGFRQINKVIPLIQQFAKSENILRVAMTERNSLTEDAVIAQESYARQLQKTREEFILFIREIADDKQIKQFIFNILELSNSLLSLSRSLKDIVPLLGAFAGFRLFQAGKRFLPGFSGQFGKPISRNKGGLIPGDGPDEDTVPAMLTKGEFVLNRKAVRKIGVNNLDRFNQGVITRNRGGLVGRGIGTAGAAIGASFILGGDFIGLKDTFEELDDTSKDIVKSFGEVALQLGILLPIISNSSDVFENISKKSNKIFNTSKGRAPLRNIGPFGANARSGSTSIIPVGSLAGGVSGGSQREIRRLNRTVTRSSTQILDDQITASALQRQDRRFGTNTLSQNLSPIRTSTRRALGRSNLANRQIEAELSGARLGERELATERTRSANRTSFLRQQRPKGLRSRFGRLARFGPASPRLLQGATIGGAIGGIAGSAAGNFITSRSLATEDREGSRFGAGAGSAISTASQFAGFGAAGGALFGPLGVAIGGVGGGLIGALVGATSGLQDFEDSVSSVASAEAFTSLESIFESLDQGSTNLRTSIPRFTKNIDNIQEQLQGDISSDVRQDIISNFKSSAVAITNFVDEVASSSSNMTEFSQKIDNGTQRFIASMLKIPFGEFTDSIEGVIKSSKERAAQENKLISSTQNFDSVIRSITAFNNAFDRANKSVNVFSNSLESFVSGNSGVIEIPNLIGNSLSNLQTATGSDINRATGFAAQFGEPGEVLGKNIQDITRIIQNIPDILLRLRNQAPLAEEGQLEARLESSLAQLNVDRNLINLVSARFTDLLGEDFKDSNFFRAMQKDLPKAVADVTAGLSQVPDSLISASEKSSEIINNFSESLNKISDIDRQVVQGQSKIFDLFGTLIQSRAIFSQEDPSRDLLANERRRTGLLTGGRDSNQLSSEIFRRRRNISNLNERISQSSGDIGLQKQLINLRRQESSELQRATNGLQTLANSTNELTIVQQQLNRAQAVRENRLSFATNFAFGDRQTRRTTQRVTGFARNLASGGSIEDIPEQFRQQVLSLLQQFSEDDIFGKAGQDIINRVVREDPELGQAFKRSTKPGQEEINLQKQIENLIGRQIQAQDRLNKILINDRQKFFTQLNQNFDNNIAKLRSAIIGSLREERVSRVRELSSQRSGLVQRRSTIAEIESRFGENAIPNAVPIRQNVENLQELTKQQSNLRNIIKGSGVSVKSVSSGTGGVSVIESIDGPVIPENLPKSSSDKLQAEISKGLFKSDTTDVQKRKSVLEVLRGILEENKGTIKSEKETQKDLVEKVGGLEAFNKIASSDLDKFVQQFPTDKSLQDLNKEISQLTNQIKSIVAGIPNDRNRPRPPVRRNSGGLIPGFGDTDSVPALLTPGEFVLNKEATKNVGLQKLNRMNKRVSKFNNGGVVQQVNPTINTEAINRFNLAVNQLAVQIQSMRDAISLIPTEINMNGRHTVDVYINGTQAFDSMKTEFASLVKGEIKRSINKMLKQKFPEAGQVD